MVTTSGKRHSASALILTIVLLMAKAAGVAKAQGTPPSRQPVGIAGCLVDSTARMPLQRFAISSFVAEQRAEPDSTGFFLMHTKLPLGRTTLTVFPRKYGNWRVDTMDIPVEVSRDGLVAIGDVQLRTMAISGTDVLPLTQGERAMAAALQAQCHATLADVRRDGGLFRLSAAREPEAVLRNARTRLRGCYAVERRAWTGGFTTHTEGVFELPTIVRLDSMSLARPYNPAYRRLEPNMEGFVSAHAGPPSWSLVTRDSLELYWSGGFEGVQLALAVHGDSLVGVAHAFQERMSPQAMTSVLLRRTACPGSARR